MEEALTDRKARPDIVLLKADSNETRTRLSKQLSKKATLYSFFPESDYH